MLPGPAADDGRRAPSPAGSSSSRPAARRPASRCSTRPTSTRSWTRTARSPRQLLAAADSWLFVTTAARYADAVPWDLLHAARERGTSLALVLNRVPAGAEDEVAAHLDARCSPSAGSPGRELLVVPETELDDGAASRRRRSRPCAAWLDALAADAQRPGRARAPHAQRRPGQPRPARRPRSARAADDQLAAAAELRRRRRRAPTAGRSRRSTRRCAAARCCAARCSPAGTTSSARAS